MLMLSMLLLMIVLVLLIMLLFDDGVIVNDIAVIVYNVVHISLFFNSIVVLHALL